MCSSGPPAEVEESVEEGQGDGDHGLLQAETVLESPTPVPTSDTPALSATLAAEEVEAKHQLETSCSTPLARIEPELCKAASIQLFNLVRSLPERKEERTVKQLEDLQCQLDYQNLPALHCAKARLVVLVKKPSKLGVVLQAQLLAMLSTLNLFMDEDLGLSWQKASIVAAHAQGFTGEKQARNVCVWLHDFIHSNCTKLPIPAYRGNTDSLLAAKDFANNLQLYLLKKRQERPITAQDVVKYCLLEDVQIKHSPVKITERISQNWLYQMKWQYGKTPWGMYINRHEREDVVRYCNKFIEQWYTLYKLRMATTYNKLTCQPVYPVRGFPVLQPYGFCLILVTHNKSTFYVRN